jgi:hypothetical protein
MSAFTTTSKGLVAIELQAPNRVLNTFRSRYGDTVAAWYRRYADLSRGNPQLPGGVAQEISAVDADMGVPMPERPNADSVPGTHHLPLLLQLRSVLVGAGNRHVDRRIDHEPHVLLLRVLVFAREHDQGRSGDQQVDRHFRLAREVLQLGSTICVGALLLRGRTIQYSIVLQGLAERSNNGNTMPNNNNNGANISIL